MTDNIIDMTVQKMYIMIFVALLLCMPMVVPDSLLVSFVLFVCFQYSIFEFGVVFVLPSGLLVAAVLSNFVPKFFIFFILNHV